MAQAIQKLPSLPPRIVEHIVLSPDGAQLRLSSRHPKRNHTDREREAEMNQARVDRWRANDKKARACYSVACDGDVLNMLVGMGQILDTETGDDKIVGEAISEMLAETAQHWKAKH